MRKYFFAVFLLFFLSACERSENTTKKLLTLDWEKATVEQIGDLIEDGADVNKCDKDGKTPLMLAVVKVTNADVIAALIREGADVNARDYYGWTALMLAAQQNRNQEITKLLIDAGADTQARNFVGWTSSFVARMDNKNPKVYALLKDGEEPVFDDEFLSEASNPFDNVDWKTASVPQIRKLIKAGADVRSQDKYGWTPLMAAVSDEADPDVVEQLIKYGADVNARNKDGWTPLMIIAGNCLNVSLVKKIKDIEKAKKLKKKKKKKKNNDDSVSEKKEKIVVTNVKTAKIIDILIKAGADVNKQDNKGMTALMIAVISNNFDAAEALLNAKTDMSVTDMDGKIVFDYAEMDPSLKKQKIYWKIIDQHYKKGFARKRRP